HVRAKFLKSRVSLTHLVNSTQIDLRLTFPLPWHGIVRLQSEVKMIKRSLWVALLLIVSACGKAVDKKRNEVVHSDVIELKNITSIDSQLVNAVKDGEV